MLFHISRVQISLNERVCSYGTVVICLKELFPSWSISRQQKPSRKKTFGQNLCEMADIYYLVYNSSKTVYASKKRKEKKGILPSGAWYLFTFWISNDDSSVSACWCLYKQSPIRHTFVHIQMGRLRKERRRKLCIIPLNSLVLASVIIVKIWDGKDEI